MCVSVQTKDWSIANRVTIHDVPEQRQRCYNSRVKHQPCDVLLWHARQLVGEDALEAEHPQHVLRGGLLPERVVQDVELDGTLLLLLLGCVVPRHLVVEETRLPMGNTDTQPSLC